MTFWQAFVKVLRVEFDQTTIVCVSIGALLYCAGTYAFDREARQLFHVWVRKHL